MKSNGSDVSSQSSEGKNETNNKNSSYTTEGPKQLASHDTAGKIFYYERSKHKIYDIWLLESEQNLEYSQLLYTLTWLILTMREGVN